MNFRLKLHSANRLTSDSKRQSPTSLPDRAFDAIITTMKCPGSERTMGTPQDSSALSGNRQAGLHAMKTSEMIGIIDFSYSSERSQICPTWIPHTNRTENI